MPQKSDWLDDLPSSAQKLDLGNGGGFGGSDLAAWKSDLDNGGGSSGLDLAACNGTWRNTGERSCLDHNSDEDACANVFKDVVTPEEMAKADASQFKGPASHNDGDFSGVVHGPNQCAAGKDCQVPFGNVNCSTHKGNFMAMTVLCTELKEERFGASIAGKRIGHKMTWNATITRKMRVPGVLLFV